MKESEAVFAVFASLGYSGLRFSQLKELLRPIGVSETNLRSVLSRMSTRGMLTVRKEGKTAIYVFSESARRYGGRISRRFSEPLWEGWNGDYFLLSFFQSGAPGSERHRLRRALTDQALRPLNPGLWVRPWQSEERLESVFSEWIEDGTCRWMVSKVHPEIGAGDAIRMWDLGRLNDRMKAAVEGAEKARVLLDSAGPEEAFAAKFQTGDMIVKVLAEDPLLPRCLLPEGWAAGKLRAEFRNFDARATEKSRPFWSVIL